MISTEMFEDLSEVPRDEYPINLECDFGDVTYHSPECLEVCVTIPSITMLMIMDPAIN